MSDTQETLYFRINGQTPLVQAVGQNLPKGWSLGRISTRRERLVFYDTFEEEALRKGLAVIRKKGVLSIIDLESGLAEAETPLVQTPPSFFASDLPEGMARKKLLQCSTLRAFINRCAIDRFISSWRILNQDDKTVATLDYESLHPSDKTSETVFPHHFSITPLKGYHKELSPMLMALPEPVDAYRIVSVKERFMTIMEAAEPFGKNYSSKLHLQLDARAPINENIRRLLQFTTSVMEANEEGIRKDIDSEFLHDFRVAVRRSRSIIRLLNGAFDPEKTAWALAGLRELGKRTNDLRDSDVYLLRREEYTRLLPPSLQPALDPFFSDLEADKRLHHRQFCRYFTGGEYPDFMTSLKEFIADGTLPGEESAPLAAQPTGEVATRAIRKALKKVLAHGRRAGSETSDTELHELRIDCKKLRYLLEFFASLFAPKATAQAIRQMKALQDNLGNFVDLSVQMEFLQSRLETLPADRGGIGEAAAIGGLLTTLYREREKVREHFHEIFSGFDSDKTGELFDELLTGLAEA
ncbi:CHAD domain-containing protein [Chlorobaculum sp. 24CR]|uniref:CHAD domain-containing protein n=1 Tax=Chlorobaculum sp. 24CR TaxID=2508878 RepID=UPI00100C1D3F|nr:CHAD domain-containing protein [Chlorobaculum sp. 24CR]RXK87857.1 CHAD domain-containing protein [Chlorobaculum sp. 24CR]